MADPELSNRFLILIGNGADPQVFAHPCGARARSVSLTNNLGEEALLDCDEPLDLPSSMHRWNESQDTSISIEGRVANQSFPMWRAWADDQLLKDVKILRDEPSAKGGGFWVVPAYLQSLDMGAEGKSTSTFSATIVGSGRRVWTPATT